MMITKCALGLNSATNMNKMNSKVSFRGGHSGGVEQPWTFANGFWGPPGSHEVSTKLQVKKLAKPVDVVRPAKDLLQNLVRNIKSLKA